MRGTSAADSDRARVEPSNRTLPDQARGLPYAGPARAVEAARTQTPCRILARPGRDFHFKASMMGVSGCAVGPGLSPGGYDDFLSRMACTIVAGASGG
jgi:hypothetical protein